MPRSTLLSLLACPSCKARLSRHQKNAFRCTQCGRIYHIRQGVPVMVDLRNLPRHLQGQVRYFEASADVYDTPKVVEPWQKKYTERLLRHAGKLAGKVFVDNACGSGYMALSAAKNGAYVLACDLNFKGLMKLRKQAIRLGVGSRLLAVCCSAEALPIRSGVADIVVANAILEHLPQEKAAVADITRITKAKGIAMITVPLAFHLINPLFLPINAYHDKQIGHLRRYTADSLISRFFGWRSRAVYYTGHTRKVFKTLVNMIHHVFDEEEMEREDERHIHDRLFASNISILFQKK